MMEMPPTGRPTPPAADALVRGAGLVGVGASLRLAPPLEAA